MKGVTKKKFSVGVLVVALLVLSLALVGCGGSGSDNESNNNATNEIPDEMLNWVGSWVSKSEVVPGQGEVDNGDYTVTFNVDNTFAVEEAGTVIYDGTWEPAEGVNGTAKTSSGENIRLELAANNTKMIFDGSESGAKKIICVR